MQPPHGWEDTLASTGRRSQEVINRKIDRCDVPQVLDFRKSLEESRQVLSHGFANEAEFKAEVDRHLRAFAKGKLQTDVLHWNLAREDFSLSTVYTPVSIRSG